MHFRPWCENQLNQSIFIIHLNAAPRRVGIVGMFANSEEWKEIYPEYTGAFGISHDYVRAVANTLTDKEHL